MSNPKYTFSDEINKELVKLENHLKEKKYNVHTIRQYKNCTGIYLSWLAENNYQASETTYKIVIEFIQASQQTCSDNQVKRIIIAIKHYHDSIKTPTNPVSGIYIKGHRKSIINDIIDYNQILDSYYKFEALSERGKRNKVILSLMIYQALTTEDLSILEPGHIRLKEGRIYVPKHNKINGRILDLDASQMLLLQEYLLVTRPSMLANVKSYRSGRKPDEINSIIQDKLFFGENGATSIKSSLHHLFRSIKKQYPRIESGKIIRATVIAEWLKTLDIRKVQYMAGHRYVSSTERYNAMNLEELKDSLNRYHPLK